MALALSALVLTTLALFFIVVCPARRAVKALSRLPPLPRPLQDGK